MPIYENENYEISKCFSAHDIPRIPPFLGCRDAIARRVAGRKLKCCNASGTRKTGWFPVTLPTGQDVWVPVHERFLSRVGFLIRSVYVYEYYTDDEESAFADAQRQFPGAEHTRHWF